MKLSLFSLIAATLAPSAIASGLPPGRNLKGFLPPPFPAEGATPAQKERYAQDANYHQVHEAGPLALSPVHPGANPARGQYQHPLDQGLRHPAPYFPSSQHHPHQDQYPLNQGRQPPAPHFRPQHQDRHPFNQGSPSQPPVHYQHQGLQHGTPHVPQHRQDPHRDPFHQHWHPVPQAPTSRRYVPKIPDPTPGQVPYGREHAHDVIGGALDINRQAIAHSQRKIEECGQTPDSQFWEREKRKHVGEGDWLLKTHESLEPESRRRKVTFIDDMTKALRFQNAALITLGKE